MFRPFKAADRRGIAGSTLLLQLILLYRVIYSVSPAPELNGPHRPTLKIGAETCGAVKKRRRIVRRGNEQG
jgi:hypothetical protein